MRGTMGLGSRALNHGDSDFLIKVAEREREGGGWRVFNGNGRHNKAVKLLGCNLLLFLMMA